MAATRDSSPSIDEQLDELAGDTHAPADAAQEPDAGHIDGNFQTPSEVEEDLSGGAFADQVQAMLDEADMVFEDAGTVLGESEDEDGTTPSPDADAPSMDGRQPATDPAAADANADAPETADEGDVDTDALLSQIDDMLADGADESVGGEFESIESLEADDDDDDETTPDAGLPPHPDELTGKKQSDDGELDGAMQSIDELDDDDALDDPAVRPPRGKLEAEQSYAAETTDEESSGSADEEDPEQVAAMNRLAEELDASEAEAFAARLQDGTDPELQGDDDDAPERPASPAPHPPLLERIRTTLSSINAPLNRLSPDLRYAIGLVALSNVCLGLGLLLFALVLN